MRKECLNETLMHRFIPRACQEQDEPITLHTLSLLVNGLDIQQIPNSTFAMVNLLNQLKSLCLWHTCLYTHAHTQVHRGISGWLGTGRDKRGLGEGTIGKNDTSIDYLSTQCLLGMLSELLSFSSSFSFSCSSLFLPRTKKHFHCSWAFLASSFTE